MDSLKKIAIGLKDRVTKTPLERMIAEVCSDENYGTSNTLLHDIAEKTYNPEERTVIMRCTWEYLRSNPKEWRRIYKALNLIEHLLKFGSNSCMNEIRDEGFKIRLLQDFSYRDGGEERGSGVRDKSKYINQLIADHKYLDEEREKAKKLRDKFSGFASNDGGRGSYSENRRYDDDYSRGGSYDPYPEKRRDVQEQQQQEYGGQINSNVPEQIEPTPIRNENPKIDIFSAPAVKPVTNSRVNSGPAKINPPPGGNLFASVTVKNASIPEPAWNQPVQRQTDIWGQPAVQKAPEPFNPFPTQPPQANVETIWSQPPTNTPPAWNQPRQEPKPTQPSELWGPPVYPKQPASSFTNIPPSNPPPVYTNTPPSNPPPVYTNIPPSNPPYSNIPPSFPNNPPQYPRVPPTHNENIWGGVSMPPNQQPKANPVYQNNQWGTPIIPADVWTNQTDIQHQGGQGQSQAPSVKMNLNLQESQGPTMSQLKANPRSGMDFTTFQSAPVEPARPVDLEAKLMNLDNLELGQPTITDPYGKYNYRGNRY